MHLDWPSEMRKPVSSSSRHYRQARAGARHSSAAHTCRAAPSFLISGTLRRRCFFPGEAAGSLARMFLDADRGERRDRGLPGRYVAPHAPATPGPPRAISPARPGPLSRGGGLARDDVRTACASMSTIPKAADQALCPSSGLMCVLIRLSIHCQCRRLDRPVLATENPTCFSFPLRVLIAQCLADGDVVFPCLRLLRQGQCRSPTRPENCMARLARLLDGHRMPKRPILIRRAPPSDVAVH